MQPVLSYSDHFRLYQKIKKTLVLDDILTLLGQELTSNDKVDGFLIALADEAELSLIIEKIQLPPKYAQMNIVYNKQHYDLKKNEFICQSYLQNRIFLLDKKFEFSYDEELKTRLKRWEINSALILPLAQDFLNQGNFSSQRENNLCIDPEYIMNGFLDNIEKTTGIRNFVLAFCDQDKKTFRIHKHRFASPYENMDNIFMDHDQPLEKSESFFRAIVEQEILLYDQNNKGEADLFISTLFFDLWGIRNGIMVPFSSGDETIGALFAFDNQEIHYTHIRSIQAEIQVSFPLLKNLLYQKKYLNLSWDFSGEKKILGSIFVFNNSGRIFDQSDTHFFMDKIHFFYDALRNATEFTRLKEREMSIRLLEEKNKKVLEIAELFNKIDSAQQIYPVIIKEIAGLFGFDYGIIFMREGELLKYISGELIQEQYRESFSKIDAYLKELGGFFLSVEESATSTALLRNVHLFFPDISKIRHLPMSEKDKKYVDLLPELKSYLTMPIRRFGEAVGIFSAVSLEKQVKLDDGDIKLIEAICGFAGTAILNSELYSLVDEQKNELNEEKNKLQRAQYTLHQDLVMAQGIQTRLFPTDFSSFKELDIHLIYRPMMEVGGDIYDICLLADGVYRVFLADATGHGVQAALTTMLIKAEYDKIKLNQDTVERVLGNLNQIFIDYYENLTVFFTAVLLDIDINQNQIVYSLAGHPSPLLIRSEEVLPLSARGKMLGLQRNSVYQRGVVSFTSEDKLMLYSDGLFEEFSEQGEEMGEELLFSLVDSSRQKDIKTIAELVMSQVEKWCEGSSLDDDITLLLIGRHKS